MLGAISCHILTLYDTLSLCVLLTFLGYSMRWAGVNNLSCKKRNLCWLNIFGIPSGQVSAGSILVPKKKKRAKKYRYPF